jgi:hypothetical protein
MGASSSSPSRTVVLEIAGVAALVALIWADEYLDLPHLLFGEPAVAPRLGEFLLEAAVAVGFGVVMVLTSFVAHRRVAYLESLLTLCAACQRIGVDGEWMPLEQLVEERDHLSTTHGICGECYQLQVADLVPQGAARQ